jgi:hypothetical protein
MNYGKIYYRGGVYYQEKPFLTIKNDKEYSIGFNKSEQQLYCPDSVCNWILYKYNFTTSGLQNFDGYVYVVNIPKDTRVQVLTCSRDNIMTRVLADDIIITQKYSLSEPATIDKLGIPLNYEYIALASGKGWIKILDLLKLPENKSIFECNRLYNTAKYYKCNEAIDWWKNSGLLDNTTE